MTKIFPLSACALFSLLVFGIACTPQKNTTYFQTVPVNSEMQTLVTKDFEHKVRVDDILLLTFTGPGKEIPLYNTVPDYVVDKNGNIQIYGIGDVKVLGLTLEQVKQKLIRTFVPDIFKQLAVTARFKNHRVLVLGEIGAPGVIPLETENMTLLEAIAMRGDLRADAKRDNVLIIRNTERGKLFFRVNLLDGSIFNSNFYYLQPDDIIYVEAEKRKNTNTQAIIGYAISGISFILLLVDRFTRK